METATLSKAAIRRAVPHVHAAIENLLRAWDEINEVEKIVDFEITTGELSDLAGGLGSTNTVKRLVTTKIVEEWLTRIASTSK